MHRHFAVTGPAHCRLPGVAVGLRVVCFIGSVCLFRRDWPVEPQMSGTGYQKTELIFLAGWKHAARVHIPLIWHWISFVVTGSQVKHRGAPAVIG